MIDPIEVHCKKLLVHRCLQGIGISLFLQYILFNIFIFLVNFNLLDPIDWINNTISYIFSFKTWIYIFIFNIGIASYGLFIGSCYLLLPVYYSSRFKKLLLTGPREFTSLFGHSFVGILTAWFYTRFLSEDYKDLTFKCFDGYCLNNHFIFLALSGINTGLYYYVRERLFAVPDIKFPVIHESRSARILSELLTSLQTSFFRSFAPTISIAVIYWFFGWILTTRIADLLSIQQVESAEACSSVGTNIRLLLYSWMLSLHIQFNMFTVNSALIILFTTQIEFAIAGDPIINSTVPTAVKALSLSKLPLIQQLASLDFFNLSKSRISSRRMEIFSLCLPGGHPVNWNRISSQILSMLDEFTDELTVSIKKISTLKSNTYFKRIEPRPNETAEKILLRQFNATYGIRRIGEQSFNQTPKSTNPNNNSLNSTFAEFSKSVDEICKALFRSIPGLYYTFGEPDGAKTIYLLSNSQHIIWLSQGLAGLCAASIDDDQYGVMHNKLPKIIEALLRLKLQLDKLNNVILNGKKIHHNCNALKGAVKRSLYRICTVFQECLNDFIDDPELLTSLQSFIMYQED